jgi:two-component system sensor histidine kinase BaeS
MLRFLRRMSFQAKLLVAFVLIVLLTSLVGYLFINQSVKRAFSEFTVRSFTMQDRMLLQVIVAYYNRTGSFDGLVEFLEQSARDVPVLLVDPEGNVVYPTEGTLPDRRLSEEELQRGQAIVLPNGETWILVPYRTNPQLAQLEQRFLWTTRRSLWLAGLAAVAVAILLSIFLLRQMTRPLRRLDAATRRIAKGEFSERVGIQTSDEIGRLARSFNEMAESLERAERTKKQMIADVSHELRTPLAAVRSALEALRDGLIESTPETLASLHDKILLTTRLVGDLHQLTLADDGRLSIQVAPCRIEEIVDTIVETIGVQLEDSSVRLDRRIPADLPAIVVDRQRIEQVFLNLLANAIRHTPEGGSISISAVERPEGIELGICDSGPGLTEIDLAHVFDRFYRADDARTGDGGAGLGLSIAKALIDAHGGRIWAENGSSGGACFHIVLPTE